MKREIVLREGIMTDGLVEEMQNYYRPLPKGLDYVKFRQERWREKESIVVYSAEQNGETIGWVVYDPGKSTVEELLVKPDLVQPETAWQLLDELVKQESLVAAETWQEDKAKQSAMIEYGFRPVRHFLQEGFSITKMELSTQAYFRRLKEYKPVKEYSTRERVALEKVPGSQEPGEIKAALVGLLDKLGGIERFVKPGQTVVLKPNIVSEHGLKDGIPKGGIVTDIRLVKALVELLLPLAGKVIIAEGASINRSATTKLFEHYGYPEIVKTAPDKISLVDLNADETVEKPVPGGKRMLARKIPVTLEEADVIISLPVMKIHFAAGVSLAVKNLQGTMPPLEKYMTHFFGLWQNLVNIHHLVKPNLIIIDGLYGQEDFGPISGTPKKMDLLIAGTNPIAVDSIATRVMGLDPLSSPPVLLGYLQGLGPVELDLIDIIGPPLDEVTSKFREPELDISGGESFHVHDGDACRGCRAYLHFVLSKLRRPDPKDPSRLLIDRPFDRKVNLFLGPDTRANINPEEANIFMGMCQQHRADVGIHLPGCPPHTEVIIDGVYRMFPDVEKAKYADKSEEAVLGEMLQQILASLEV